MSSGGLTQPRIQVLGRFRERERPTSRRIVAGKWNRALQQVTDAQAIYERQRHADRVAVDARARILALATDFPRLWQDPHTPDRERKRMVRLLMDDVTLIKAGDGLTAHVLFRGGATTTLTLARALNAWQLRETSTEIVALIDHLLDSYADRDIAPDPDPEQTSAALNPKDTTLGAVARSTRRSAGR